MKVHKIQPQWNKCKLFRPLNTIPLSFTSWLHAVRIRPRVRMRFALYRALESENISRPGNKLQLEPLYLCGRFWEGSGNVNTGPRLLPGFISTGALMVIRVVEIQCFIRRACRHRGITRRTCARIPANKETKGCAARAV